jgi:Cu/Ag efflux protein CusF
MEHEMKNILAPALVGFAMVAATFAYAADATGAVKAIDAAAHTVTLDDSKVYVFPASVDVSKLKVGDKVKVTFTSDAAGKNNATAVTTAS